MKPTSAQLAPSVIPIIRDYVQACIDEAVAPLVRAIALEKAGVEDLRRHLDIQKSRVDEKIAALEFTVAKAGKRQPLSAPDIIEQLRSAGMLNEAAMASLDPSKKVT